jgi:hypothetical protein
MSFVFFCLFAAVLIGVYVGIRRRLAPLRVLGAVGVLGGIFTMWIHAVLVGVVLGGGLSLVMVILAGYFLSQDLRASQKAK